jgi:hypothetical protein
MFSLAAILRPDKPRQRPRARAGGMGRTHVVVAAGLRRLTRSCAQISGPARMTTEDYVLQTRVFMLRIWQAQKCTFGQHSPGKNAFAPLAQLAEQLTLNHADVDVSATMLPNTLRFGSVASRHYICHFY